ncbi:MAG: DUF6293 family protein [Promethearchaeia archaeon]
MFANQIHVVFNAKEDKRITDPILKNPPNKLYYFTANIEATGQKDENMDYFQKNTKLLEKKIPTLEIIHRELDYTNYIQVIQEISKIIKDEREENENAEIYINVGTGSKITALASSEASKLWNCYIYYVFASKYDPSGEGPQHKGEMFIKEPITFPIKKPKPLYIKILKLFKNMLVEKYQGKEYDKSQGKYIFKKNFIDKLIEEAILQLEHENENERKRRASYYMKSKKYFEPLEDQLGYIEISDDKRNKKIRLTKTGKDILKIFKHLV